MEGSIDDSRYTSVIPYGVTPPAAPRPANHDLVEQAKTMIEEITEAVQTTTDVILLEDLLGLCDRLNNAIARMSSTSSSGTLHGLRIKAAGEVTSDADLHGSPTDEQPLTPRVDKGKGRAEPEPEEPEKVLSPTFMITESEDEDEDDNRFSGEEDQASIPSPVVR